MPYHISWHLYLSALALLMCLVITALMKYLSSKCVKKSKKDAKIVACDILILLNKLKPLPVNAQKGWRLTSCHHGRRCWWQQIGDIEDNHTYSVYAAYSRVPAPAQVVYNLIKDTGRTADWYPGVTHVSYTAPPARTHNTHYDSTMFAACDEVEEYGEYGKKKWLHQFWGAGLTKIHYTRLWHRETNGCCWLLKLSPQSGTWMFFLIQPAQAVDQCSLTILCSSSTDLYISDKPPSLVTSIHDWCIHRKLNVTPLSHISLPLLHAHEISDRTSGDLNVSAVTSEVVNRIRSFVSPEHRRRISSEQLRRSMSILKNYKPLRHEVDQSSKLRHEVDQSSKLHHDVDQSSTIYESDSCDSSDSEDNIVPSPGDADHSALSSTPKKEGTEPCNGSSLSSSFADLSTSGESVGIDDLSKLQSSYQTRANHCAAHLLTQVLQASNIDIQSTIEQQSEAAGGWMFSCLDQDVVILKKTDKDSPGLLSYMGKGILPVTPQVVWDAIRNPRTRFTYDETLKKVDILQTISDKMKIIYLYHESVQLFRRDGYRFFILQNERLEGDKHILCLQSIEWKSAAIDSAVTVKLLPSGWVIEPVSKDGKSYSMVTYMVQMDSRPSENGGIACDELLSRQPICIAYLRDYLKSFVYVHNRANRY